MNDMNESDFFNLMCRLCLAKSPENIDLFSEESIERGLPSKIHLLFSVSVSPEEDLPRTVCRECSKTLDFINTFRLNVENAQKTILSLWTQLISTSKQVDIEDGFQPRQLDVPGEDDMQVQMDIHVPDDNAHDSSYEERSFVSLLDESCEASETSIFSDDNKLADPLEEPLKSEQLCEDKNTLNSNGKNFPVHEDSQQFLPTDEVLEFVEIHQIDETYSPADSSDESSSSEESSTDVQVNKGNKRKTKTLKRKRESNNQEENKTAKQPPWTNDMEEEVQNFYQFTCELCSSDTPPFENFSSLCRHFRSEHDSEGYLKCCKRKIYCRSHLYQHMILHTRPEMYKCPECDKQLCGPINLKQHLQSFHLPKTQLPFRCSVCGRGFATKTAVENHEKSQHFLSHEEKFIHECDVCQKRFASPAGVSEHKKQVHEQIRPLLCDICAKAFPNQSRLRKHMTSHSSSENIKCPHCDQRLKNSVRLQVHMKRHQGVVHACQQCDKSYPTRRLLQRHFKTHSDDRPHECSICGKRYRESSHLKTHFNQHTGALPFCCQWCPKRFSASGPFYTHRKKVHPEELARANQAALSTVQC